jgi:hypothetical protein
VGEKGDGMDVSSFWRNHYTENETVRLSRQGEILTADLLGPKASGDGVSLDEWFHTFRNKHIAFHFKGKQCKNWLHNIEDKGSMILRNVGDRIPNNTVSYSRRKKCSNTLLKTSKLAK